MQELLLFGQVPGARHEQVLKVLAGLTAMQPQRVLERHAVYKPLQAPKLAQQQVGGSQDIQQQKSQKQRQAQNNEVFYLQLVQQLERDAFAPDTSVDKAAPEVKGLAREAEQPPWSLHFEDVPLPGQRPVTQRQISRTDVVGGDPHQFMASQGYTFLTEYVADGHRFTYNNVSLSLRRMLRFPAVEAVPSPHPREGFPLPPLKDLAPLDESGAYLLEARVLLAERDPKPELVARGTRELLALQSQMRGVVGLAAPERLALDTRVK